MKTLKPRFFVVVLLLVFLYKALEVFIFEAHNKTNSMGLPQYCGKFELSQYSFYIRAIYSVTPFNAVKLI